jgi:hypothetical protein
VADLPPHPLVLQIAMGLSKHGGGPLEAAVTELRSAINAAQTEPVEAARLAAAHLDDSVALPEKTEVARQLGERLDLGDLALFGGYLGPYLEYQEADWRLLYLDERLQRWLLAPKDSVIHQQRQSDERAAFGKRDAIWVRGDAQVVQGSGPQPIERRFIVGDITRASDVQSAPSGGTQAAATGLFCVASTPFCCYGSRSRR